MAGNEIDHTRRKLALSALSRVAARVRSAALTIANPLSSTNSVVSAIEWAAEVVLAAESAKTPAVEMTPASCAGCSCGPARACSRYGTAKLAERYRIDYWCEPDEPRAFNQVLVPTCYEQRGKYTYRDALPASAVDPVMLWREDK